MTNKAFTLIELSIVLIIIGLLVGGVLAGRELIEQARQRQYIQDMRDYELAIRTFDLKYGALPGDLCNASDYWPGALNCSDSTNPHERQLNNHSGQEEVFLAWDHLERAGLIEGQYTGTGATANNTVPGENVPINPWNGAYAFNAASHTYYLYAYGSTIDNSLYGDVGTYITASFTNASNQNGHIMLVPSVAHAIDIKADDGTPSGGRMHATGGRSGNTYCTTPAYSTGPVSGDVEYDLASEDIECTIQWMVYEGR